MPLEQWFSKSGMILSPGGDLVICRDFLDSSSSGSGGAADL